MEARSVLSWRGPRGPSKPTAAPHGTAQTRRSISRTPPPSPAAAPRCSGGLCRCPSALCEEPQPPRSLLSACPQRSSGPPRSSVPCCALSPSPHGAPQPPGARGAAARIRNPRCRCGNTFPGTRTWPRQIWLNILVPSALHKSKLCSQHPEPNPQLSAPQHRAVPGLHTLTSHRLGRLSKCTL